MCGSMVDIQSPTAEIRRGKKKEKEITWRKYNVRICYAGWTLIMRWCRSAQPRYHYCSGMIRTLPVYGKHGAHDTAYRAPRYCPWSLHLFSATWTIILWPPYEIGQAVIFLPCRFYLTSFFFMAALLVLLQITWHNFGELDLRITCLTSWYDTRVFGV